MNRRGLAVWPRWRRGRPGTQGHPSVRPWPIAEIAAPAARCRSKRLAEHVGEAHGSSRCWRCATVSGRTTPARQAPASGASIPSRPPLPWGEWGQGGLASRRDVRPDPCRHSCLVERPMRQVDFIPTPRRARRSRHFVGRDDPEAAHGGDMEVGDRPDNERP
jgi:hypothetical protein